MPVPPRLHQHRLQASTSGGITECKSVLGDRTRRCLEMLSYPGIGWGAMATCQHHSRCRCLETFTYCCFLWKPSV